MRIQLDLDNAGREQLGQLEKLTGIKTHTDLFNVALTLLDWTIQQRIAGRIIASLDEKNMQYKELQMPPLEYAAKAAKNQAQEQLIAVAQI